MFMIFGRWVSRKDLKIESSHLLSARSHRNFARRLTDKQAKSAITIGMERSTRTAHDNDDARTSDDEPLDLLSRARIQAAFSEDELDDDTIKLLQEVLLSPAASDLSLQPGDSLLSGGAAIQIPGHEQTRIRSSLSTLERTLVAPSDVRFGGKPTHPYQAMISVQNSILMVKPAISQPRSWLPLDEQLSVFSSPFERPLVSQSDLCAENPVHPFQRIMIMKAPEEPCTRAARVSLSPQAVQPASAKRHSVLHTATSTRDSSLLARSIPPKSTNAKKDNNNAVVRYSPSEKGHACNCKRNKCLKLYCGCFAAVSVSSQCLTPVILRFVCCSPTSCIHTTVCHV